MPEPAELPEHESTHDRHIPWSDLMRVMNQAHIPVAAVTATTGAENEAWRQAKDEMIYQEHARIRTIGQRFGRYDLVA